MNKKILTVDIISFFSGVVLLLLIKFFYVLIGNGIISSVIFGVASIAVTLIIMRITYKCDIASVNIINFLVAVLCLFSFFAVYCIPFFGFVGQRGANNGLLFIFLFMFGAKYFIYLANILNNKTRNVTVYKGAKTLKSTKKYYKIITIYAWILLIVSMVLVAINIVFPLSEISASLLSYFSL